MLHVQVSYNPIAIIKVFERPMVARAIGRQGRIVAIRQRDRSVQGPMVALSYSLGSGVRIRANVIDSRVSAVLVAQDHVASRFAIAQVIRYVIAANGCVDEAFVVARIFRFRVAQACIVAVSQNCSLFRFPK